MPDSHNSRSFLSRWLAPWGWAFEGWTVVFVAMFGASFGLVVSTVDYMRRYSTPLLEVKTHIAHHKVVDATSGTRELLLIPTEGDVYFRLVEPYDRLLEPVPSDDQPVSFSYHRVDCEPRLRRPDSVDDHVLLCRPSRVLVGTDVVLSTGRTRREQILIIFGYALLLVGSIALGFKVRSIERWWWRSN
ncbi:MAG: hypothetical protein KKC85_14490 [Gammaproteobacteria bacterium]|nr:hypothetical protein [Gammaproteobacteria bacterium]